MILLRILLVIKWAPFQYESGCSMLFGMCLETRDYLPGQHWPWEVQQILGMEVLGDHPQS